MSDLIRRKDAVREMALMLEDISADLCEDILTRFGYDTPQELATEAMSIIPSAERKREWIPCSERLPSEQGQYLVTFPLCNGDPWVYVLSFSKGKFYETDDEWGDIEYDDVTAWMPLPKPYEERKGE